MFDKIFEFNQKALNLYAKRQEILSSNIANADTPNYKSIDINFKNELIKILRKNNTNNIVLSKTSNNHLNGKNEYFNTIKTIPVPTSQTRQDGNTVNMDRERIEFINNSLKYQSNLSFIKNEIKNMIYVLQG